MPEPDHPLYQIGTGILGWDLWREQEVTPPDVLRPLGDDLRAWVGAAHIYGLHATIGDALDYTVDDLPEIEAELRAIAATATPFTLTGGRIHHGFRSGHRAVVATFDSAEGAVQRLEEQVVTRTNARHRVSPNFGPDLGNYSGLAREHLQQFGSPMVRSLFDLHFSLATSVPNVECRLRLVQIVETDLG
ncbi:MAG: hypothetical protein M3Y37_03110, partial [Chloroflexota bacterium]|nr:hypothetical protein [Chloroflexota bacterium]